MEIRVCEITGKQFSISPAHARACEALDLPLPTLSPEERCRRLLAFRNEEQFFWRTCNISQRQIASVFPPNTAFPVIAPEYWWDESFDAIEYGQEFDFKRLFIEQLLDLWWKVPRPAFLAQRCDDVVAVHNAWDVKKSFLVFNAHRVTNSCYSMGIWDSGACSDCYFVTSCDHCYECTHCYWCRWLRFSEFCSNCEDSWFLSHCRDCKHCMFCANLEGKEYHVFNQPVSKEEYERIEAEWFFSARARLEVAKERFREFLEQIPVPHLMADNSNQVTGNYLRNCRHAEASYECRDCSDIFSCHGLVDAQWCVDGIGFGEGLTHSAQFVSVGQGASRIINSLDCWNNVSDLAYSTYCEDSRHLFACVGLRGKEFCIFNRQYTELEYHQLRAELVDHLKARHVWGKFLPANFSPFPYNCSSANEHMPLSRIPAKMLGFFWDDQSERLQPSELLRYERAEDQTINEAPAQLGDLDEEKSDALYLCELSGKPFRILAQEIKLYKALGVAPPARSYEVRHRERIMRLARLKLDERTSSLSGKTFVSAFPEQWKRPVVHLDEWQTLINQIPQREP